MSASGKGENPGDAYCSVAPGAARLRQTLYPCACLFRFRRYQSRVFGKSLSISANYLSFCTMSKLDDSSGALSATAVAKETLKDRVTQARSTFWADKCRLWLKGSRIRNRWSPDAR